MDIICISGISGSGKTTLGKLFVDKHNDYILIDQDSFFLKNKPKIMLSNGNIVSNWDCIDCIDWDLLNETVIETSKKNKVLLTGFALWNNKLKFKVKRHIHLTFLCPSIEGQNKINIDGRNYCYYDNLDTMYSYLLNITNENQDIVKLKCSEARLNSKNINSVDDIKKNILMVEEIVFPFYIETLKESKFTDILSVNTNKNKRVSKDRLLIYLENVIN
jgi:adenylate kinase family enzyme